MAANGGRDPLYLVPVVIAVLALCVSVAGLILALVAT